MKDNLSAIDRYLRQCVLKGCFPGAVCYVGDLKSTRFVQAYGRRQIRPDPEPMRETTLFDLASLTKPIVTAVSIMKLSDGKKLRLDDRVDRYLADFKGRPQGGKTIRQLLTHTAGFPAWFPMYSIAPQRRSAFLARADQGSGKAVYSCLGYLVLAGIVEQITRVTLDVYFRDLVRDLALKNTGFCPGPDRLDVAATEDRDRYERRKCGTIGVKPAVVWRDYLIRGEVHDGNCHYGYRGVAGNAGLFSTARDLARFMRAYIRGEIVRARSVKMMTTNFTGGPRGRGLGWMMNIYPGSLSPSAYGHTGFTGTMVCYDPANDLLVILLTNDIHPRVRTGNMPPIRKRLMNIVSRELRLKVNE